MSHCSADGTLGSPPLITAAAIECVAGIVIGTGLGARDAAFVASGEMAVACSMTHAPRGFWPVVSQGELAMFYCAAFCTLHRKGRAI